MNISIRTKANIILFVAAAGILASFPFQHTFIGGLLFAAFSAATIGGLADSFAISALFGNPLRIRWPEWMGTHIIARNRERLIRELAEMVEHELLTVSMIRETLPEHSLGQALLEYLNDNGGAEAIHAIAQRLAGDLMARVDTEEVARGLERFLQEHADMLQISDLIADIGDWTIRNGYDEQIIRFLLEQSVHIVGTKDFRRLIEQLADTAIKAYEGDKFRRRLVDYSAGLNATAISEKLQVWLIQFLEQFKDASHPQHMRLKEQLLLFIQRLREDEELRKRMEDGKLSLLKSLEGKLKLDEWLKNRLNALRELAEKGEGHEEGTSLPWLREQLDYGFRQLNEKPQLAEALDRKLKSAILDWVERKHSAIGGIVQDQLQQYSEAELIQLVQEKAGKDLQYIRLNGMIVGMLVGILFYLLTFWIGGIH
ncbi:DUF445 domain-containing protein [Paenibacillus sp. HB172176]|uniref:DUF445 domain-containing protein n=1 Tax=Paenibacillus sp. HB172176 TaxID=2493690 RepID=UPI0014397758|nr:DUF445 domain-containing protein [Paenibacillus sp. HB172176]